MYSWKHHSFSSENISSSHNNSVAGLSSAKDLKARLQQSAAKTRAASTFESVDSKRVQFAPEVPMHQSTSTTWDESRLRSLGAMTPRTQAQVDHVMDTNVRRAVETQAKVVKELCKQGSIDAARAALGSLRRVAPEVVEMADFWEAALMVERKDPQRAATCMFLAMKTVQKELEKDSLQSILLNHLRMSGLTQQPETLDEFFFPVGKKLSFHQTSSNSPQPPSSPVRSPAHRQRSPVGSQAVKSMATSPGTPQQSKSDTPLSTMKERMNSIGKLTARLGEATEKPVAAEEPVRPLTSLRAILNELPRSEVKPSNNGTCATSPSEDSHEVGVHFDESAGASPERERTTKVKGTPYPQTTRHDDFDESPEATRPKMAKGTPYPRSEIEKARVLFASPAVRVPTPKKSHIFDEEEDEIIEYRPMPRLQSRSPARAAMFLMQQQQQLHHHHKMDDDQVQVSTVTNFELKGSIVVLSPVKQTASATKRVATPVRRSSRTATMSAEKKNIDALRRSDYTYIPNSALIDIGDDDEEVKPAQVEVEKKDPETPGSVRRSARKVKFVDRLSPRLNSKFHG